MKTIYKLSGLLLAVTLTASCSKDIMTGINTDKTKPTELDPNSQLTTALLQTYGDFGMMDTYRCYITGFTQHLAGGWNVSNYAGSVYADNDMMRAIWDKLYPVAIKNLTDAISRTGEDNIYLNAVLRIHKVYLMSILTDTYGDIPCFESGAGYLGQNATPAYDTQKEIYYWFFDELEACITQLSEENSKAVTGDVTSLAGDRIAWMKYANSLRLRYAMRISDVEPAKAREEFEKALTAGCGYIATAADNAYVKHIDAPFTLYDGANDLDFRANALGEMLYGQDSDSPSFVCATFYEHLKRTSDPRLNRIARHYINNRRSSVKADDEWNVDVTDEVLAYQATPEGDLGPGKTYACLVGCAWWHNWVNAPSNDKIPKLQALVTLYPDGGFDQSNYPARMMRPFLSIKLEKAECPGILMTSAEVHLLCAEAIGKGWNVHGTVEDHYAAGVREAMQLLNDSYDIEKITESEINDYLAANPVGSTTAEQKEAINTQAWILHLMNPSEAWANLRRSDYPVLDDRSRYELWGDFQYDTDLTIPVRLKYPALEAKYNKENYDAAIERLGGKDDWHKRLWWDKNPGTVKPLFE